MKKKKERLHTVSILNGSELSQNVKVNGTHVDLQTGYFCYTFS